MQYPVYCRSAVGSAGASPPSYLCSECGLLGAGAERSFCLRYVADVQNTALSVDSMQKVRSSLGLPHLLDQYAPAREHIYEPGDDGLQQRVQLFVGGRSRLDESGCAIGAAPLHPVQHQAAHGLT